jgi:hypothetical protein
MNDFAYRSGRAAPRMGPNELAIRKSASDNQRDRYETGNPATPWEADHFDKVQSFRRQKAFEMPDDMMPSPPVLPGDA